MTELIIALGASGLFASRAFLPAFAAALLIRFGPEIGVIPDSGLLENFIDGAVPTWFTSNAALLVLGVLAALEFAAERMPEARAVMNEVDKYWKPAMAFLVTAGVIGASDAAFVEGNMEASMLGWLLAAGAATGTYVIAVARGSLMSVFIEADEEDDLGLMRLFTLFEDIWAFFGVLTLILFPIFMLALIGLVTLVIFMLRRRAEKREEQSRVPCEQCGESVHLAALACPKCGCERPVPRALTWLGVASTRDADKPTHPQSLASRRRCTRCAERLEQRTPRQTCPACGLDMFASEEAVLAYDRFIAARLPGTLLICAGLSLIPIFGLVPGVIVYRTRLVGPYRRYLPRGRAMLTRWGLRLLFLLLIFAQVIPFLGAGAVPLMAFLSYRVYRRGFLMLAKTDA